MNILYDAFGELIENGEYIFWRKDSAGCCRLINWPYLNPDLKSEYRNKPEKYFKTETFRNR